METQVDALDKHLMQHYIARDDSRQAPSYPVLRAPQMAIPTRVVGVGMKAKWTRILAFSCAAVVLLLLTLSCHDEGPGPVSTDWQFAGGIIFELNAGSLANGICVIDPSEVNPTTHPVLRGAAEPRLSPDGKKVLQRRLPGNTLDLFVSNLDGTDAHNLTNTDQTISESDGDWAPDMQRVVCHALFYPTYREAIRVVSLDGTAAHNITDTNRVRTANYPRWSPDGTKIAYLAQDTLGGLWWLTVIAADGSNEQRVGQQTSLVAPVWSPDGRSLAWAGAPNQGLLVFDFAVGHSVALEEGARARDALTCWLPDSRLIFSRSVAGGSYQVKVASFSPTIRVDSLAAGFNTLDGMVLSPKKDHLVLFARREGETALSLYLMALDGSGLSRVGTVDPSAQARLPTNGSISWVE